MVTCAELVLVVCGDVDDVAGSDWLVFALEEDGAFAFDDVDLVLVVVAVSGGVAAGLDEYVSHCEVWRVV